MKKYLFGMIALAGILSVSCNKVAEPEALVPEVTPGKHLVTIKASIAPGTRTSYADDKTFSWKEGDVIQVMTLSADESYLQMVEFTAESTGTTTTFTGEVEDGYTLYGNAFYTAFNSYVAFGGDGDSNIYLNFPSFTYIDGDSETYYTAESANPLSNLPLLGFKGETDDTYVFQTAAGAVKFTFENIPEGAEYVAVEGSMNYLSGMFSFDETGVATMEGYRPGSYQDTQGNTRYYSSRYVVYHFERNADGTATIYMPMPVGEIPAGATVDFYDGELENILYSRTIRAAIPVERNRVTEVAGFSATSNWEEMDYGYYYDLLPFYFMNSEVNTFAAVKFYKDAGAPGVYQFDNPYIVGAADREYTIPSTITLPEKLSLTILKDDSVVYDDFHTGYKEEDMAENDGDWFAACPANWGDDNSYNFVAKYHEDGTPDLVILSPLYLYQAANGGYYYAYSSTTWKNMWVDIYFPGADLKNQYDLSASIELTEIVDDNPAQPIAAVELKLGTSFAGADLVVATSKEQAEEMIAAGLGTRVTESGTYEAPFPADAASGEYYAYAKTIPAEGFTERCAVVFEADAEYDYYRSDEDLAFTLDDIVGSYTANNYYRTATGGWTDAPVDLHLTVEESDDPISGYDIMFTDLCPEIASALAGRTGTVTKYPVYATFDTVHGTVVIPKGQVAYSIKLRTGTTEYTTGDYSGNDIQMVMRTSGVLRNKANIGLWANGSLAALTNANTTYTRDGSAGAPAKSFRYSKGDKTYLYTGKESSPARYPGLDKRVARERIPFTGIVPSKVRQ